MTIAKNIVAGLCLLIGLSALADAAPHPVKLRPAIVVDGSEITVGDLFSGAEQAGEVADITISLAPAPGRKVYFKTSYLAAVARRIGLHWQRPPGLKKVAVTRSSQIIPRQDVIEAITDALDGIVEPESYDVQVSTRYLNLHVSRTALPTVAVENLNFDQRSGRFTATLLAPADDPAGTRTRVSGRIHETTEIPTLKRRLNPGDVITARDIEWLKVRNRKINRNIVRNDGELIGMSLKRGTRVGRPIRISDIQRPIVVKKGSKVVMELRTNFMTLTAAGKALENGGQDDVIQIVNLRSRKTIQATVIAPGKVTVDLAPRKIAASAQ